MCPMEHFHIGNNGTLFFSCIKKHSVNIAFFHCSTIITLFLYLKFFLMFITLISNPSTDYSQKNKEKNKLKI